MIKKTHTSYVCPGHIHYQHLLNIDEPTSILGWQQLGKKPGGPWKCTVLLLLEGRASDLFVAIFKQNISKQSKGWEEQASLITLSILNPTVCHGLK